MSSVYFGGSRHLPARYPNLWQIVRACIEAEHYIHVGCQHGADEQVAWAALLGGGESSLVVFAVAPSWQSAPEHVKAAAQGEAAVVWSAGGSSAPMHARFLLRSIAAFQGCSQAVFFAPGPGSLAVARECVSQGLPVFAFGELPAPIPSHAGQWVPSQFMGFSCWSWSSAQLALL